jgi:hypothetical protein
MQLEMFGRNRRELRLGDVIVLQHASGRRKQVYRISGRRPSRTRLRIWWAGAGEYRLSTLTRKLMADTHDSDERWQKLNEWCAISPVTDNPTITLVHRGGATKLVELVRVTEEELVIWWPTANTYIVDRKTGKLESGEWSLPAADPLRQQEPG